VRPRPAEGGREAGEVERGDLVLRAGGGEQVGRRLQAEVLRPARERLEADHGAVTQVDDGLEDGLQVQIADRAEGLEVALRHGVGPRGTIVARRGLSRRRGRRLPLGP
jgi:hypothetical protein